MKVGEVVIGRFLLQKLVGEGGTSKVYQAFDRATNDTVALKVLSNRGEFEDQRFRAEARILADLTHPSIVGYIAHGETSSFESFIAMQWLEGETLHERLQRGRLSLADGLSVIRQTAGALAEAHARGLVHRDLKPSNLFLVRGDVDKTKVLDFGIAKFLSDTGWRTGTGTFLGTVGYMAPEQAVAARDVAATADVFALGCVLFECLTGRPAFVAEHAVALLAKVLTEPAPRLSDLSPELRGPVDSLVTRMLAKEPSERPFDASALLVELDTLFDDAGEPMSRAPSSLPSVLTGLERRVVSVALVESGASAKGLPDYEATQALAAEFAAEVTLLLNGALLLVLSGRGNAVDRASRAASLTLAVRRLQPEARVVLSTGWAAASLRAPVGPVIDRAAALLHEARTTRDDIAGVVLDTTTARLLATRFEIKEQPSGSSLLVGVLSGDEPPARLLGKITRCVGRERELTLLASALSECAGERSPRAVLVTADAGVGKSRLAREFTALVRREGLARVIVAKSDSTGAGSAFLLARQLISSGAGLGELLEPRAVHAALVERLSTSLDAKEASRCSEFLCELLGTPVDAEPDSVLSSALGDARLMSEWIRRSFQEWLSVEAAEPLVIVLEDLHWGDAPTVNYLGEALWRRDLPLLVLALARREVEEAFPNLWSGAQFERMGLSGLGRRAAEELVRSVLHQPDETIVHRVVERASGNAFYLEELIRAVAEGHGDAFPESVVAMAHAGLERLDPASRRVLRAASVFGERFTAGAVIAIVGDDFATRESLDILEEREVISSLRSDPSIEDRHYSFRHALLRDAAYETFTEGDRTAAHLRAADWLDRSGGADPVVMVDHLDSAGAFERAVPYLVRAAERAYAAGSPADTRRLAARGLPHAKDENLGALRLLDGASALLEGDFATAAAQIEKAKPLLDPASDRWFLGISTLAYARTVAGAPAAAIELVDAIQRLPVLPMRNPLCAFGIARGILALSFAGDAKRARSLIDRVDAEFDSHGVLNPSSRGWLFLARGFSFMAGACSLADSVTRARVTVDLFEEARDALAIPSALTWLGSTRGCIGEYRESMAALIEAISRAVAGGNLISPSLMKPLLELARALAGEPGAALDMLAKESIHSNPLGESVILWVRGYILYLLGRFTEAETVCRAAIGAGIPISAFAATAILARLLLLRNEAEESLAVATACMDRNLRDPFFLSSDCALVRAESLRVLGRRDEARAAILDAAGEIERTAAVLPESYRRSYRESVRSNACALRLAAEWA
ncbi:MAG TPA: protein kinase [Polyangiaceae bacterium]|jgi:tetratricopeptide (TPR) repeat protein|nr:protein kinase [Polyangiaceae bacterium]